MNQYEFISYKPTPGDQYMLGVATVRLYGKVVLRYKHVKTKDGAGDFFTCPSYTITDDGEKKYMQAFMLDSRSDEETLMEIIRKGYRASLQQAKNPIPSQDFVFSPQPGAMQTQAVEQNLPF